MQNYYLISAVQALERDRSTEQYVNGVELLSYIRSSGVRIGTCVCRCFCAFRFNVMRQTRKLYSFSIFCFISEVKEKKRNATNTKEFRQKWPCSISWLQKLFIYYNFATLCIFFFGREIGIEDALKRDDLSV